MIGDRVGIKKAVEKIKANKLLISTAFLAGIVVTLWTLTWAAPKLLRIGVDSILSKPKITAQNNIVGNPSSEVKKDQVREESIFVDPLINAKGKDVTEVRDYEEGEVVKSRFDETIDPIQLKTEFYPSKREAVHAINLMARKIGCNTVTNLIFEESVFVVSKNYGAGIAKIYRAKGLGRRRIKF